MAGPTLSFCSATLLAVGPTAASDDETATTATIAPAIKFETSFSEARLWSHKRTI